MDVGYINKVTQFLFWTPPLSKQKVSEEVKNQPFSKLNFIPVEIYEYYIYLAATKNLNLSIIY